MQRSLDHNQTSQVTHRYTALNRHCGKILTQLIMIAMLVVATGKTAIAELLTSVAFNTQSELQPVGNGTIRWFGFTIYDASLWTGNGSFSTLDDSLPVALHITYRKNIKSSALAARTKEEWEGLKIYSPAEREKWEHQLTAIWPSVKSGDSITTLVTNDRRTHFYYNNELIHNIDDPKFGIALLSIWLHPDTSQPALRSKLIGQREE